MENRLIEAKLNIQILGKCGEQGCNAQVYFAKDPQTQGHIVVKVLKKSKLSDDYFSEAEILYAARHDSVVEIRCAAQDDSHVYLVMDKYKNGSIGSLLKTRNITCRESIKYAVNFLSGLHSVHTKQLVHFDIKPSNILISDSHSALLSDFGLSKHLNSTGFASPDKVYGLHYPPEYVLSDDLTVLSDIYQSGVTLYRMLNGDSVWNSQKSELTEANFESRVSKGRFPDRNAYLFHVPYKIRRIVNKSMSCDPNKRYQTALSFHNALSDEFDSIDWLYSFSGNTQIWQKSESTKQEVFTIINSGNIFSSSLKKTILSSGNTQNVSKGTKRNIPKADLKKFCEEILLGN